MLRIKRAKIAKPVPVIKLIPNFITLLALIVGISSIRLALEEKWQLAVYCILVAAILDGVDGRVARMLNATSPFGAELDSLCDFANFGIAPAYIIYLWSFQHYEYKLFSWVVVLLFIVCMALRLARFNTSIFHEKADAKSQYFFTGVPAPIGALLAIMPLILDFDISTILFIDIRSHTIFIGVYIGIVAFLLASRFPTFSSKHIHIKPEYLSLSMVVFSVVIISIIIYPWYSLPIFAIIYILSIPICALAARRLA